MMEKKKKGKAKPNPKPARKKAAPKPETSIPPTPSTALTVLPRGRPTLYSRELAKEICQALCETPSLRRICALNDHFPAESTVRQWALHNIDGFYAHYVRARDLGLDSMAEEMIDIADSGENDWVERERKDGSVYIALDKEAVMRSALRVDVRKWYLSKIAPKKYDKPLLEEPPAQAAISADYVVLKPDEHGPDAPIL